MAKPLVVSFEGATASFSVSLLDRRKIYGSKRRVAIDSQGRTCTRAALTTDGATLIIAGMTAQGYFTKTGRPVARGEMVGIDAEGKILEMKPSTLGVEQKAHGPVDPSELLNLAVQSVYFLETDEDNTGMAERLKEGAVLKVAFNYAAGLGVETAYLVGNDAGCFAIVGTPVADQWVEEGQQFEQLEESDDADDLDFDAM
jgi:hypothetical protein